MTSYWQADCAKDFLGDTFPPSPTWNGYETRQTLLLYVFVDLTVHSVQFSISVVYMATLGSNQSESRKDNGAIVFGSCVSLAWDTSSIFSRDPFRPIRKQQRICLFGHQAFEVELTGLVCACVNLKLRPVPSHHWKNRMLNRTSNGCRYPQKLFPDSSHWEGWVMTSPEVTGQRDRKSIKTHCI